MLCKNEHKYLDINDADSQKIVSVSSQDSQIKPCSLPELVKQAKDVIEKDDKMRLQLSDMWYNDSIINFLLQALCKNKVVNVVSTFVWPALI